MLETNKQKESRAKFLEEIHHWVVDIGHNIPKNFSDFQLESLTWQGNPTYCYTIFFSDRSNISVSPWLTFNKSRSDNPIYSINVKIMVPSQKNKGKFDLAQNIFDISNQEDYPETEMKKTKSKLLRFVITKLVELKGIA